jgi:DNA-binding NtrC family response regulator
MISTMIRTKTEANQAPVTPGETNGEPAILVVEDDGSIRRLICTVLRHAMPALVVEAADAYGALSIARWIDRPITLLISDINLSAGMSGIDLAQELAGTNPSLKVLLMSPTPCSPSDIPASWRFLSKPFPLEAFLDCVTALCRSGSATTAYFG